MAQPPRGHAYVSQVIASQHLHFKHQLLSWMSIKVWLVVWLVGTRTHIYIYIYIYIYTYIYIHTSLYISISYTQFMSSISPSPYINISGCPPTPAPHHQSQTTVVAAGHDHPMGFHTYVRLSYGNWWLVVDYGGCTIYSMHLSRTMEVVHVGCWLT